LRTRYGALAVNVAAGWVGSRGEAEELVNLAFSELSRETREGRATFADAQSARNALFARLRELALTPGAGQRARPNNADDDFDPSDPEIERASRRHGAIELAVGELNADLRAVFDARFREHATREAAARRLGVPLATVQARERALLDQMRQVTGGGRL
jgi:DNA-directed RNA polymerase specialized sigma24 family protein